MSNVERPLFGDESLDRYFRFGSKADVSRESVRLGQPPVALTLSGLPGDTDREASEKVVAASRGREWVNYAVSGLRQVR